MCRGADGAPSEISAAHFPSIQAALDAHPGRVIRVPDSDYRLDQAIVIRHAGSGLSGYGRLIQTNPKAAMIEMIGAADVRLRNLTLMRPTETETAEASAINARDCAHLSLIDVRVIDNRAATAAVRLQNCRNATIRGSLIENYAAIGIDDRTASPHYGYAFHCIEATAISANSCSGLLVQANRIIEERIRPTPELKQRYKLGQFVKRAAQKGSLIHPQTWEAGYVNNWHQGSAIVVTGPTETRFVRVLDNHIENAAQGIDLHADFVTVSGNVVVNSFMGMKAMHGSRHVLIANNQFIRNDLWAIGLMPGAASHPAQAQANHLPNKPANLDGGHLVVNNIIADFGHGDSWWIWNQDGVTRAPLLFDRGQEPDDPPLRDVIVSGNVIRTLSAEPEATGQPPPRYRFAVWVDPGPNGPVGLHFSGNLFPPGRDGVSNIKLEP